MYIVTIKFEFQKESFAQKVIQVFKYEYLSLKPYQIWKIRNI